jgi:peptidoglycan/LPS O-acetylase OafA/YrhL
VSQRDRIPVIDQLRGLAALSVAWFHLTNAHDGWVAISGTWGWLGVDAFFVISGFVIPYALAGSHPSYGLRDFPRFLARRIVRLEPPYLASIAAVIVLNILAASTPIFHGARPSYDWLQILAHLCYLIPLTDFKWIQPVYWSLAYEFAFYLMIGLIFPLIGPSPRRWEARAAAAAIIALVAAGAVSHLVALFVMGFAVHRRLTAGCDLAWTLALIVASAGAMAADGAWEKAAVGAATALAILFHRTVPAVTGRLGATLTGLGAISYSLYLLHVPIGGKVVNFGRRFVEGAAAELVLSIGALAISITAAVVFWRLVEQPATATARLVGAGIRPVKPGASLRQV